MKAHTIHEAWSIANEIFPTDYTKNESASERAGYDVYTSNLDGCAAWVSDLGDRLEINLDNGKTINIWIEAETVAEAVKTPSERVETIITLTISIHRGNRQNNATKNLETSLVLSHETTLKNVAQFEKEAAVYIKEARRAARQDAFVFVDLSKARYRFTNISDLKQEAFEMWSGCGLAITGEGAHLTPDKKYNDNPAHDMWLTGDRGEILNEITI